MLPNLASHLAMWRESTSAGNVDLVSGSQQSPVLSKLSTLSMARANSGIEVLYIQYLG